MKNKKIRFQKFLTSGVKNKIRFQKFLKIGVKILFVAAVISTAASVLGILLEIFGYVMGCSNILLLLMTTLYCWTSYFLLKYRKEKGQDEANI